jgi:hypothetical protein
MKKISFLILFFVFIAGCHDRSEYYSILDKIEGFVCDFPGKIHYDAWGANGMSKSCVRPDGNLDGSYITLDYGNIFCIGTYKNGQEVGLWVFFGSNGKPNKIIKYNDL